MFDWIVGFFRELLSLIPKAIYLLNSSLLSLIDFMQLLFRKLAGLDVYYITNDNGETIATTGDLLTNFIGGILGININGNESFDLIDYSLLSTVFWSFVIFGLIILFISTLVAIIKSHYTYNEKSAKGPLPILATAGKAIVNMVAVPVIVILGLYLSQAILNALDQITAVGSDDVVNLYGSENTSRYLQQNITDSQGNQTYIFYDMFGFTGGIVYGVNIPGTNIDDYFDQHMLGLVAARTQPFSGSMFKVAGFNANRVRSGEYTINTPFTGNVGSTMELFSNHGNDSDVLANMVDEAFANFLHLDGVYLMNFMTEEIYDTGIYLPEIEQFLTIFTSPYICSFSKFNIGLVWYYYNLWNYNFIVGFGSVIVCVSIFLNIIMGLMSRLFMAIVLFLVMPPLAGLAPLDEGKAFGGWREAFMKQVLMAYGAVVGMNLVLLILPYINEIDMFGIPIVDSLVQTLFIIVGLITIKAVISTLSQLIGAADANKTGDEMSKEVKSTIGRATAMTIGAAKLGARPYTALAKRVYQSYNGLNDEEMDRRVGNVRGQVQAFLSGGIGGLRNERNRQQLEDQRRQQQRQLDAEQSTLETQNHVLENAQRNQAQAQAQHRQAQIAELISNSVGASATNEEIAQLFKAYGYNDNEIAQIVQAASDARGALSGLIDKDLMSQNMEHFNRDYGNYVAANGGDLTSAAGTFSSRESALNNANNAVANAQNSVNATQRVIGNINANMELNQQNLEAAGRQAAYYQRHPGVVGGAFRGVGHVARTSAGAFGLGFGGVFDKDTMDTFGGAMEKMGVKPKGPNYDRIAAESSRATAAAVQENTASTQRAINELTQEIRRMNRNNRP